METCHVMYALCCCLQLMQRVVGKHETIVLSSEFSGSYFESFVDGATIMSEDYYKDRDFEQKILLKPADITDTFIVQVIYMDIGCEDGASLSICEMMDSFPTTCSNEILASNCGKKEEHFKDSKIHHLKKTQKGNRLMIIWNTGEPSGNHRGFRITVTAFKNSNGNCDGFWKCRDNMCITRDLHCDGVVHCLDASDETYNCSNFDLLPSMYKCDSGGGTFPCVNSKWNERWFGVAIPMLIVLVLFLVAFVVKVRNMICRPPEPQGGIMSSHLGVWQIMPPLRRRRGSSRSHNQHPSQLNAQMSETQLQNTLYGEILSGDAQVEGLAHPGGGRPVTYDPVNMMLLPPPYSPPSYPPQHQYHPPTEGEPPPIYEEFDTSTHSQCQHLHHQPAHQHGKDATS